MSLPPELQKLISDLHKFLTGSLAQEVLSENSEDMRDDLSSRLAMYLQTSHSTRSLPRLQVQSVSADPILRDKTMSAMSAMSTASPELPRAPPPGEVKKVSPKDLLSSALNEGTIEKLGGKNQEKWQKRYCILTPTYLYFFENAKSKKQNNQIYIPAFSVTPVKEKGNEKHYCFKLSTNKEAKSYYFRVNDADTFSNWVQNLIKHSASSGSLAVGGLVRAVTMVINPEDVISSASSSDEGGEPANDSSLLETIREDENPPPVPPPTDRAPRSPQVLRKISSPGAPAPPILPPPSTLSPPPLEVHPPSSGGKHSLDVAPPAPQRSGSVLESGPGVSVQQLRKIKHSQLKSLSEVRENSVDSEEMRVDTERVYETSEEEDFPYDKIYAAKWDFFGEEGDELSFKRGELLLVADPSHSTDWWIGDLLHTDTLKARDQSGLFYSAYAEPAFVKV